MLRRLVAAALLLLSACVPVGPTAPAPSGPVRIAWADVGVPTPFRVSTAGPGGPVLLSLMYDTLTWKDEHGVIPWLATGWQASPDGLSYTFQLAPGVSWQDGQPLTAEDVAFSFAYYSDHPYRWLSTAVVAGADVIAPDTVRVHLRQPFAPFLDQVAGGLPIIPRHVWQKVSDPLTYDGTDATVGSGPYHLAGYDAASGAYRLVANQTYFKGVPSVPEIQQLNVPAETQLQALRQGQLELALAADASVADLLKGDPRLRVFETAPLSVVRLAINTDRPPLDRREVRQALAYALDRPRLASSITRGPPIVGSAGVIPPETPWFAADLPTYTYDPVRSRALLGDTRLALEMLADPVAREPELMTPMLAAVGIDLAVRTADPKTRTQLLREGAFQMGLLTHIGVGGDPDFLRRWYSGEEANEFAQGSVFHDAQFNALAAQQAATSDASARAALVDQMQARLADELPTIPLYYRRFYWVYDSTRFTPMNTWGGLLDGVPLVTNKLAFLPHR